MIITTITIKDAMDRTIIQMFEVNEVFSDLLGAMILVKPGLTGLECDIKRAKFVKWLQEHWVWVIFDITAWQPSSDQALDT